MDLRLQDQALNISGFCIMVLGQLKDGASRHLQVFDMDEGSKRLLVMLCLPLVDGVFATLLVSGAITTFSDIVAIALTIFSGAGALAVLFAESESKSEARDMVLEVTPYLLIGALGVSLVAPVFQQLFNVQMLQYTAGIALATIALKMLDISLAEKMSVPAILVTGLVLSSTGLQTLTLSLSYVAPALATVVTALAILYAASAFSERDLNLEYVRIGGGLVVGLISLSMFGVEMPSEIGLAILAASIVASMRSDSES